MLADIPVNDPILVNFQFSWDNEQWLIKHVRFLLASRVLKGVKISVNWHLFVREVGYLALDKNRFGCFIMSRLFECLLCSSLATWPYFNILLKIEEIQRVQKPKYFLFVKYGGPQVSRQWLLQYINLCKRYSCTRRFGDLSTIVAMWCLNLKTFLQKNRRSFQSSQINKAKIPPSNLLPPITRSRCIFSCKWFSLLTDSPRGSKGERIGAGRA